MTNILYKGPIGKEDIAFGSGTFTRRASLGTVTITRVPNPRPTIEDHGSSFTTMLTDLGSSASHDVYVNVPVSVTADTTITPNIHLIVEKEGLITVATGKTLTINGPFEAGDYQVFSGAGAVAGLKSARSIWFTGTSLTTEVTAKLQKSLDAVSTAGGEWFLNPGTHLVTLAVAAGDYNYALLLKRGNVRLHGVPGKSILKADAAADCTILRGAWPSQDGIAANLENVVMENIIFDGNWDNQTWDGPTGGTVYDQNGLVLASMRHIVLRNITIKNTAQDGLSLGSCDDVYMDNVRVESTGKANINLISCTNVTVINPYLTYSTSSPDAGVAKAYYTLASEGYAALFVAHAPSAEFDTFDENNVKIIAPTIIQKNGRGIVLATYSATTNEATDFEIVAPYIIVNEGAFTTAASRVAIAAYGDPDSPNTNVRVIGGHIRSERNAATRVIDFLDISRATVIGTDIQGVGASSRPTITAAETIAATDDGKTAQAGAAGTITLEAATASAVDDHYNGGRVTIVSGTGAGQTRRITDYDGTSKVATIAPNWTTNPDATSVYDATVLASTVHIEGVKFTYPAAAWDSIDLRDLYEASIIGCGGNGMITGANSDSWIGKLVSTGNTFDTAIAGTTIIADYRNHVYQSRVSWTRSLATINAGVTESTAVYVPGASIGDVVVWSWDSSPPTALNALIIKGYVNATNSVTMLITNPTAGNIGLGTDKWKIGVIH